MQASEEQGRYTPNAHSWLDAFVTREDTVRAAEQMRQYSRDIWRPGDRYEFVEPGLLERVQPYAIPFITKAQRELEAANFRHVGDIEDVIANSTRPRFAKRAFIRTLLHRGDMATTAGLFCMRLRGLALVAWILRFAPQRTVNAIDLETELSDGRVVLTSNLLGLNQTDPCPGVIRRQLKPDTPVDLMLFEHRRMLEQALAESPGATLRPVRSPRELIEAQERMIQMKRKHLEQVGHVSASEIRKISGGKVDRGVAMIMEEADAEARRAQQQRRAPENHVKQ